MKRIALFTCVFTVIIFGQSFSQTEEGAYLHIDYLKVDAGNFSEFENMVSSEWKSVYENEAGPEKMTGLFFYKVLYPSGEMSDYNYAIVTTYNNLDAVIEINDRVKKKLATINADEVNKPADFVTHQFSELWDTEAEIMSISGKPVSTFMVMNYMMVNPGKEAEYLTLENDMARPLHEERINKGEMHSWRTFSLLQPGGINYGYNFATADYFDKVSDIEYGFTNELIKSVMPGSDINEMFNAIYATRDIVKSELWQLIESVE
ncbi:MAG: hypothetical protein WD022_04665 [Balneolaceae bacterium]